MIEELNKLAKAMRDMSDMVGDHHWMAAKAVEDLIKKDARIAELEDLGAEWVNKALAYSAELAAIKAQEPVQVDYVAVMRADGDGGLEVEWLLEGGTAELMNGMYLCCVGGGTLLFEEGSGHLYAAPVSEAKAQGVVIPPALFDQAISWIEDRRRYGDDGTLHQVWRDLKTIQQNLRAAPSAPAADAGLVYCFECREIGESDWVACDYPRYLYCQNSPEMDTRVVLAAHRAKGVV